MKVTIENGELVIRLPVNDPPVLSASQKTLLVASDNGKTSVLVQGKVLVVGVNAYIKR